MKKPRLGAKRAARDAKQAARKVEWKKQDVERQRRSKTASGKLRAAYKDKAQFPVNAPGDFERLKRGNQYASVEKRVYRFRGVEGFDAAVDVLTDLRDDRPQWRTWAMIGDGYKSGAVWISSRVDMPEETSVWLQGVGITYTKKGGPFGGKKRSQLWVEVVAIRRAKKVGGVKIAKISTRKKPKRKAKLAQMRGRSYVSKNSAKGKAGSKTKSLRRRKRRG